MTFLLSLLVTYPISPSLEKIKVLFSAHSSPRYVHYRIAASKSAKEEKEGMS